MTLTAFAQARAADARHRLQRSTIHSLVERSARSAEPSLPPIAFTAITDEAIAAWDSPSWRSSPHRRVDWDWDYGRYRYRKRYARMETAIWSGTTLCGLVLGRFSTARTVLQVNFVEGSPDPVQPLRGWVLRLVVQIADVLGEAYGANLLRFTEPAPHVQRKLLAMKTEQFRYVAKVDPMPYDYCDRDLPP